MLPPSVPPCPLVGQLRPVRDWFMLRYEKMVEQERAELDAKVAPLHKLEAALLAAQQAKQKPAAQTDNEDRRRLEEIARLADAPRERF